MTTTTLKGILARYVYQGANFWSIAKLESGETLKGKILGADVGDTIEVTGTWETDAKYGRQLHVKTSRVIAASDHRGIVAWLEKLPGIGPRRAAAIVDAYGPEHVFDVIEHKPDKLATVPGITSKMAQDIHDAYIARRATRDMLVGLRRYMSEHIASLAIAAYGSDALEAIKRDPYKLIDLDGVGFKTADTIALSMGVAKDAIPRAMALVLYALDEAAAIGHCYVPRDTIARQALRGYGVPQRVTHHAIDLLSGDVQHVIIDGDTVWLPRLYEAEMVVCDEMARIAG